MAFKQSKKYKICDVIHYNCFVFGDVLRFIAKKIFQESISDCWNDIFKGLFAH